MSATTKDERRERSMRKWAARTIADVTDPDMRRQLDREFRRVAGPGGDLRQVSAACRLLNAAIVALTPRPAAQQAAATIPTTAPTGPFPSVFA